MGKETPIVKRTDPKEAKVSDTVERRDMCVCMTWAGYYPESWGVHHHKNCDNFKTEKFPYLFYYEEAINAWVPVPDKMENLMSAEDQPEIEEIEIRFKRIDMTDEEIDSLPEG